MKLQPVLMGLTVINCGLLAYGLSHTAAAAPAMPAVLRAQGLEIVDKAGKVRASISVMPTQTLKDGSVYPETVLLRLITSKGKPTVKVSAMEDGAAMSLSSDGPAYAQILARTDTPVLNLMDKAGKRLAP